MESEIKLLESIDTEFLKFKIDKKQIHFEKIVDLIDSLNLSLKVNTSEICKNIFDFAPDDFFQFFAEYLVLKSNLDNKVFDIVVVFNLLGIKETKLSVTKCNLLFEKMILENRKNTNDKRLDFWLNYYLSEDLELCQNLIFDISKEYDSILANWEISEMFFEYKNYENSLHFAQKCSKLINQQKKEFNQRKNEERNNGDEDLVTFFEELSGRLSTIHTLALKLELSNLYFKKKFDECISKCNEVSQLVSSDESFEEFYKKALFVFVFFYSAFSYAGKKDDINALEQIDNCLTIGDWDFFKQEEIADDIVNLRIYLFNKFQKYREKSDFIKSLKDKNNKAYFKYKNQIEFLENQIDSNFIVEPLTNVYVPKTTLGKRLLSEISHKGNEFTSEKLMEAFLVNFIDEEKKIFGKKFKIYHDDFGYGRQLRIKNGFIDLLLLDEDNDIYVIELKKDRGYNNPLKQILEYRKFVETYIAKKDQKVYAILCLKYSSIQLKEEVSKSKDVYLYTYDFVFNRIV